MTSTTTDAGIDHTPHHRAADVLAAGMEHVRLAPSDRGTVELLVARPAPGEREVLTTAEVSEAVGVIGDSWDQRPSSRTPDGGPNPDAQVTVMNARAAALVAGDRDRWAWAGDQVYVDLDVSLENLPTGTRLHLGDAILEVTAAPHTGCAQFKARFGIDALRLTATPDGRALRLRGINTRVVRGGAVTVGDEVAVERP